MIDEKKVDESVDTGGINEEKKVDESVDTGGVNEESKKQEDLDKIIQSKVDKTAQKIKSEYERKISELQSKLTEAEREKMSDAERFELEKQEAQRYREEFEREKLTFELSKKLGKEGLPLDLAEVWLKPPKSSEEVDERLESMLSILDNIKSSTLENFRKEHSRTSVGGTENGSKEMTRKQFEKLPSAQKNEFVRSGGRIKE